MQSIKPYQKRPVRFLEIYQCNDWKIKIYSISIYDEFVKKENVNFAKANISAWLESSDTYPLETYKIATLILHEFKDGYFAIINWWIDENMLQHFVYLATKERPAEFNLFSDKGIIICVWEMAVLWFERNNWVENVLMKSDNPDFKAYLQNSLNDDV